METVIIVFGYIILVQYCEIVHMVSTARAKIDPEAQVSGIVFA